MQQRSLRLPFGFLILFALFSIFRFRAVLRGGGRVAGPPPQLADADADAVAAELANATLFRLAADEVWQAGLRKDVEDLLEGNLPASAARAHGRARTSASLHVYSQWARENHLEQRGRYAMRLSPHLRRAPKDYRIFPEVRRALRDWFRGRRLQGEIMSELVGLVKRPIDRHYGLPDFGEGRRYGSCAVVGNSGILLKNDHGHLIDGHDLVIRLNNARTEGYQRHVGAKTGLSFVNSNILHTCARKESCFCHPYGENVPIIMYICQAVHFIDYTICNSSHKAPLLITDARFDLLCSRIVKYYSLKRFVELTGKPPEEWKKAHDEKYFHYSSGMQALMLALGICDQVSVFGFGKSVEAKHHYHTNQRAELDLHDYQAEYAFYHDLMERPEVIPFLKDSKVKVPPIVFYH